MSSKKQWEHIKQKASHFWVIAFTCVSNKASHTNLYIYTRVGAFTNRYTLSMSFLCAHQFNRTSFLILLLCLKNKLLAYFECCSWAYTIRRLEDGLLITRQILFLLAEKISETWSNHIQNWSYSSLAMEFPEEVFSSA